MPRGPFDSELDPDTRRDLGERLRALLEGTALDMRGMSVELGVEPEVVVVALRELRASPVTGRLRSAVELGRVTWWWEAAPPEPDSGENGAGQRPKGKKEKRRKG